MLQRIANLFRRGPALSPVQVITGDNLRLTINRFDKPCGHPGFLIVMELYCEYHERWLSIACLGDLELGAALRLLTEAGDYVRTERANHLAPQYVD